MDGFEEEELEGGVAVPATDDEDEAPEGTLAEEDTEDEDEDALPHGMTEVEEEV